MKHTPFLISCRAGSILLSAISLCAQAVPAKQPVYIFLDTSIGDHVNWPMTEERLRRTLPVLEKYRKDNPSLTATVYFSGAVSEALSQHNAQDRLLDFVRGYIQRGIVRAGYDGTDEPAPMRRPMVLFSKETNPEDRWLMRMDSATKILNEARDPLRGGDPLKGGEPIPGKSGALKRMQEVFGPPAAIRGVTIQIPNPWGTVSEVGSDSEIVNVLRQFKSSALMEGLDESNLGHTAAEGYRPWADSFSRVMSPAVNTSPEVFWQEDVVRLSESSLRDWRTYRAEDGVPGIKRALEGLDRSHPRFVRVEIGGERAYVKPPRPPMGTIVMPINWAYLHPDNPLFPDALRYSPAEMDAKYAQEEMVVQYLVSEFLQANPGSRFVSPSDVQSMARTSFGYDLPLATLRPAVTDMLQAWGDKTTPPTYLKVGDRYLSLADLFEVLTDALAQQSRSGKLPASVHVARVFGPISTVQHKPLPQGEVTAESVGRVCAKLIGPLHDDSWSTVPHNAIPSPIEIDSLTLTPAQFLRLMSEALVAPSPATKLTVKPIDMFAGRVITYNSRRLLTDLGAAWTYKPAVLELSSASR